VQVVVEGVGALAAADAKASREALDARPPDDEPGRGQEQQHQAGDGEQQPADRELVVDEVDAVAVHDVCGLERRRLAAHHGQRLGVRERVGRRGRVVALRVHHAVDLLLVEQDHAAHHDDEQQQPEHQRRPAVGHDQRRAHGEPRAPAPPLRSRSRSRRVAHRRSIGAAVVVLTVYSPAARA
jgi:hypothetical protein